MKIEGYVTVPEFAKTLGVSAQYVHKIIKQGRIKNVKRFGKKIFIIHKDELKWFRKAK